MDKYCSGIPNRPAQVILSLGSAVGARAIETIATVSIAAVEAMEIAGRVMRVEDGALFCTDADDVCCSYCCFIDYETSI